MYLIVACDGGVCVCFLETATAELYSLCSTRAAHDAIASVAREGGMQPLWVDGLAKAETGQTSLEELHRVVPR
jgi:type II secretory ATPase GspE/PulE/Tfp pilus assembly ATPase PilB-like protein